MWTTKQRAHDTSTVFLVASSGTDYYLIGEHEDEFLITQDGNEGWSSKERITA